MKAIVTFTVPGGKRLIARAIAGMPEVRRAQESGKILVKGGTTTSAIAENLVGVPMRISGRISPTGLKIARDEDHAPHNMLIQGSEWRNVDVELVEVAASLRAGDVVISGANVIDPHGGAAVMAGASLGGKAGLIFTGVMAEGVTMIVAAGLEKLIPGTVQRAMMASGRSIVDRSLGMAVGLMPIFGQVITEVEAVKLLSPVECEVIGRGGVRGAEGGVTLAVWGEAADVDRIFRLALELREATTSGSPGSVDDCEGACDWCRKHRACVYRSPKLLSVLYPEDGP